MTIALSVLALAMGIQLDVPSTCPSADQIRAQLHRVLPSEASLPHLATVSRTGQELSVELRQADGTLLAHRALPLGQAESCDDQARAVAVLLAAWELQLKVSDPSAPALTPPPAPGDQAALPAADLPSGLALPVLSLTTQPSGPTATQTPTAPPNDQAPVPSVAESERPLEPPSPEADQPTPPSRTLDVGAGVIASLAGGRWALGGLALLVIGDHSRPWIGVLALTAVSNHAIPLGTGTAEWSRFALNVGPGMRFHLGDFALEPYLLISPAWLHLSGTGFIDPTAANGFDLGLGGGARLSVSWRRLRPWVAFGVMDWLLNPQVFAHGLDAPETLPNVEVLLQLGLSFDAL